MSKKFIFFPDCSTCIGIKTCTTYFQTSVYCQVLSFDLSALIAIVAKVKTSREDLESCGQVVCFRNPTLMYNSGCPGLELYKKFNPAPIALDFLDQV